MHACKVIAENRGQITGRSLDIRYNVIMSSLAESQVFCRKALTALHLLAKAIGNLSDFFLHAKKKLHGGKIDVNGLWCRRRVSLAPFSAVDDPEAVGREIPGFQGRLVTLASALKDLQVAKEAALADLDDSGVCETEVEVAKCEKKLRKIIRWLFDYDRDVFVAIFRPLPCYFSCNECVDCKMKAITPMFDILGAKPLLRKMMKKVIPDLDEDAFPDRTVHSEDYY